MLAIRVDGNKEIGTGHVQRCISISQALKEVGINVIFITADSNMGQIITSNGFKYISTETKWDNMEEEIPKIRKLIDRYKINTLILDSYRASYNYIENIGSVVSLYYIDDFYTKHYKNLKGVISYNIGCNFLKTIYESNTNLLLGSKYIPLRQEFNNIKPINISDTVKNIIVTTGGTDKYLIIETLINSFKNEKVFKAINFHIIVGNFFTNKEKLKELSKASGNIILYENINNISEIMLKSDMAISAGGTTLYELCACGIPMVTFSIAHNQLSIAKGFCKNKIALYSGGYANNKCTLINNIIKNTLYLIKNKEVRYSMHINAIKTVDTKGAQRIAMNFI